MVHRRVVQVGRHGKREDRTQVLGLLDRGLQLGHREVADPQHPDVAVAPGLRRGPLDEVVDVAPFLLVEESERAARAARATEIRDHMDVATRHPEVGGAGLDETHRRAEILNLARIGRRRHKRGIRAVVIGPVHVGK